MVENRSVAENLSLVKSRIADAARKAKRTPEDIVLVGVAKTVNAGRVEEALAAGLTDIGENYVQEASGKKQQISRPARWHMVGHLQKNKAKQALETFDVIQTVDSLKLLEQIGRRSLAAEKKTEVLLQVNTSGEESKYGIPPGEIEGLAEAASRLDGIGVTGLMTIGRFEPDPEAAREEFRMLARLFDDIRRKNLPNIEMQWLSMGMTHDFEVAIEEGANLVRIGRGIFGARRE